MTKKKTLEFRKNAVEFTLDCLMIRTYKWGLDRDRWRDEISQYVKQTTAGFPETVPVEKFHEWFDPWKAEHLPVLIKKVEANEDPVSVYPT